MKLEVGKTYLNKRGEKVTITEKKRFESRWPYWGNDHRDYAEHGKYEFNAAYDLIAEIKGTEIIPASEESKRSFGKEVRHRICVRVADDAVQFLRDSILSDDLATELWDKIYDTADELLKGEIK